MTKMRPFSIAAGLVALLGWTSSAAADVTCDKVITQINHESDGKITVYWGTWHELVDASESSGIREARLSLATAALLSGYELGVVYSGSSYNCNSSDTSTNAIKVQLQR